jgi:D-serine deaminase-like pyridoxal phosphate-dependent protein
VTAPAATSPDPTLLHELQTPAAVVDLDRLAYNVDRMAAYAAVHGLALRPHVKTHKSPRVAAEQIRSGATGVTCATVREAEVMSEVTDDVFVAYPVIGRAKLERLMRLPPSVRLIVAVDSADANDELAAAASAAGREVRVRVELDVGMRRVGVAGPEAAVALAQEVAGTRGLLFDGVTFYPGHIRQAQAEQGDDLARLSASLGTVLAALERAGLPARSVSGGSTPAAWRMHEIHGLTEVRPGTYVYNDRTTVAVGACAWDDCAFTVLATVVSTSVAGQAVIDAGTKALAREPMPGAADQGWGALLDRPEVTVMRMSEEHGVLDLSQTSWKPEVGDVVRVVPNHVCVAQHLFDEVVGARGRVVETRWAVAARGR